MVFTDDTYSDIVASFTLESGYKTGDISINKNNQVTLPSGVNFKKYVNNITSIKINGVEKQEKAELKLLIYLMQTETLTSMQQLKVKMVLPHLYLQTNLLLTQ